MLKRLNDALPELILGILAYGAAVQLIGVWFVNNKLLYSTGLWFGVILAVGMAIHMAVVIEEAVSVAGNRNKLVAMSLLRYAIVVITFFCVIRFRLGDPIVMFVGVMGLKIAAYAQPFFHRAISKLRGREE